FTPPSLAAWGSAWRSVAQSSRRMGANSGRRGTIMSAQLFDSACLSVMESGEMSEEPTVFVVDDDDAIRKSLRWLIESVDLKVQTFESAQEFLEAYDSDVPGCLVLDVRMKGMS